MAESRPVLGPGDHARPMTEREFQANDFDPNFRFELIRGQVYVSPSPNPPHQYIVTWLLNVFRDYSRKHPKIVKRVIPNPRVQIPDVPKTTPEPDIAVYNRYPKGYLRMNSWLEATPFIVVEVTSEDIDKDLGRNVALYERVASIREYWVVHPGFNKKQFFFRVYAKSGVRWATPPETYRFGDIYKTSHLPGLRLELDPDK